MKLLHGLAIVMVALTLAVGCQKKPTPQTPDPPSTPSTPTPTPAAAALSSVSLSPTSVTGDGTSIGTLTLNAAAPTGGAIITLSSSNVAATLPGSATVLAGATTQTFLVTTHAPSTDRVVVISGVYSGVTKTADLLVRVTAPLPPPAASIAGHWTGTLTPCAFCGGSPVTIVVDITQSGSAYSGTCTHGGGAPGALTGFHLVTTASNYEDFLGACLSGSVDARFFPGDDYISWIWKSDYTAVLTRH